MREASGLYYYHNDHLGTPQRLTDATTATIAWSAGYAAFGKATVDPLSTIENNLRFPGQYYDEETELHYNWMRTYDPATGKYSQADTIGFYGGDYNLSRYVAGNPNAYIDPEGEAIVTTTIIVTLAIIEIVSSAADVHEVVTTLADPCASGLEKAGTVALAGAGFFLPGGGYAKAKHVDEVAGFFEVLTEAPIKGATRSSHRNSANKALADALEGDPEFRKAMDKILDADVLAHMKSGKSGLKNPPGTEWHHPKDQNRANAVELLRKEVHRDKSLQDVLHKDGTGGWADRVREMKR
jgi:RHS repeat-associated protein